MNYKNALKKVIDEFYNERLDLLGNNLVIGERTYVKNIKNSYQRTLRDIQRILPNKNEVICELGSFLGIVSKSLAYQGYKVNACDIPSFFDRKEIKDYYFKAGIDTFGFNLRDYKLPFEDSSQDLVIACEVFEHLNFNPLPVFDEINRVLKLNGYLYIAMPNSASFIKRIRFLFTGKHPTFSIRELFRQLDPNDNMIVGLHWREFSKDDSLKMITPLGFTLDSSRISAEAGANHGNLIVRIIKFLIYKIPGFGNTQVLVFKKVKRNELVFTVNKDS